MRIFLPAFAFLFCAPALWAAENSICRASLEQVAPWTVSIKNEMIVAESTSLHASITLESALLPSPMSDWQFAQHIGEEEVEESPPLKTFGQFRGRRWIEKDQTLNHWWLMKGVCLVHLTLRSSHGPITQSLASETERLISLISMESPKQPLHPDASRTSALSASERRR
jgi:hypothetical protein